MHSAAFATLVCVFWGTPVLSQIETCESPVQVQSIEVTDRGLIIRGSAPMVGRIVDIETVQRLGFAGFSTLTIEIPGVVLGDVRSRDEWASGAFVSMRIVRYRLGSECGLRVRLQPRAAAHWILATVENGVVLTQEVPATRPADATADDRAERSGTFRVGGSYARARIRGIPPSASSQLQAAFAQELPRLGTLRGFVATATPHAVEGFPYRGLSLAGVVIGPTISDFTIGDLTVNLGETTPGSGTSVGGLMLRGGGISALLPHDVSFQVFSGRAAQSTLLRLPGDTEVVSPLSKDRVYGAQAGWMVRPTIVLGAGWIRSVPEGGRVRQNLFQSLELRPSATSNLRIMLEESLSRATTRRSGTAITIEPRFSGKKFNLAGYMRWLSDDFVPPLASSFFAGLRRSYGLFGNYAPTDRLTTSVSFGQTKAFSIFDPEEVGTLTEYRSGSIGYRVTEAVSTAVDYSTSHVESELRSLVPADSDTRSVGLSGGFRHGRSSTSVRLSHDETVNHIDPSHGLESKRLDLDTSYSVREETEIFGRGRLADSERPGGGSAGADYAISLGVRSRIADRSFVRGEVGFAVTPAGIAATEVKRAFATLGYQNTSSGGAPAGVQVTYEALQIEGGPTRHAFFILTNLARMFEWGPHPRPLPPFSDRSLPLVQSSRRDITFARVAVIVFVDENLNGRRDEGERNLRKVRFRVDNRSRESDADGELDLRLTAGRHRIVLEPGGDALDYFVSEGSHTVVVRQLEVRELSIAAQPGGRIAGRITFKGEPVAGNVVEGIRVVAKGRDLERESVTDDRGEFRFPVLPAGDYVASIDPATLDPATAVEGDLSQPIKVIRGDRSTVGFAIRRKTARERILRPDSF